MSQTITLPALGPGPAYQSVKIWIPQLILEAVQRGEGVIEGKTFTDCLFDGPAVILPLGSNARSKLKDTRDGFVKVFCLPTTGIVIAPRERERSLAS